MRSDVIALDHALSPSTSYRCAGDHPAVDREAIVKHRCLAMRGREHCVPADALLERQGAGLPL